MARVCQVFEDVDLYSPTPQHLELLTQRAVQLGMVYGDLIRVMDPRGYLEDGSHPGNYRNDGLFIFDGEHVCELEFDLDEYGHLPEKFRLFENGINELDYWSEIAHNGYVWVNIDQHAEITYTNNLVPGKAGIYTSFMVGDQQILVVADYVDLCYELEGDVADDLALRDPEPYIEKFRHHLKCEKWFEYKDFSGEWNLPGLYVILFFYFIKIMSWDEDTVIEMEDIVENTPHTIRVAAKEVENTPEATTVVEKENCVIMPRMKFFFASIISFSTTGLAMYLIITDRFQNTAVSSFAVGLITTNLAFWTEPPKYKS